MTPMKHAAPDRRQPSKAHRALAGVTGPRSCNPVSLAAAAGRWPLDLVSAEIGSLPINALAIALALKAGTSDPNLDQT